MMFEKVGLLWKLLALKKQLKGTKRPWQSKELVLNGLSILVLGCTLFLGIDIPIGEGQLDTTAQAAIVVMDFVWMIFRAFRSQPIIWKDDSEQGK